MHKGGGTCLGRQQRRGGRQCKVDDELFGFESLTTLGYVPGESQISCMAQMQAAQASREIVAWLGILSDEYSSYSQRIGGASHFSAGGASPAAVKLEGGLFSN